MNDFKKDFWHGYKNNKFKFGRQLGLISSILLLIIFISAFGMYRFDSGLSVKVAHKNNISTDKKPHVLGSNANSSQINSGENIGINENKGVSSTKPINIPVNQITNAALSSSTGLNPPKPVNTQPFNFYIPNVSPAPQCTTFEESSYASQISAANQTYTMEESQAEKLEQSEIQTAQQIGQPNIGSAKAAAAAAGLDPNTYPQVIAQENNLANKLAGINSYYDTQKKNYSDQLAANLASISSQEKNAGC